MRVGAPSSITTYLHVVLGELFRKRAATCSGRVHSVVDGNLAILVVEPSIYVLATFFENLLTKHHRRRRRVGEEVVLGNTTARTNRCATIVSEMEDPSLDTEPRGVVSLTTLYVYLLIVGLTRTGNEPLKRKYA